MLQRFQLILISLLILGSGSAQQVIPIIHADSSILDIRDGDSLISKKWILFPKIRPDVYQTPNAPETKWIKFISNKDSAQIKVEPGKEYDLVVILSNKDSCFIKISPYYGTRFLPAGKPASHSRNFILIIAIITMVVSVVLSIPSRKTTIRLLLVVGMMVPFIFWIGLWIAGLIHGHYDHLKRIVSQLGAIGTRSEWFIAFLTWIMASGIFAAGLVLLRVCRRREINTLPVLPLFLLAFSFALLSFSPLGNDNHAIAGSIGLLFALCPVLSLLIWKNKWGTCIQIGSIISLVFLLLILLKFVPLINNEYPGIPQRFYHLGWTTWLFATCFCFYKRINKENQS